MDNELNESLVDKLYDLQHDLAKYIRMPLTYLPPHATDIELREALHRALRETYRRGESTVPAQVLWRECMVGVPSSVRRLTSFARLETSVTRALAWEHAIDDHSRPLDRTEILSDFGSVSEAIDLLIVDVEAGEQER